MARCRERRAPDASANLQLFYIEYRVWELEPVEGQFGKDCDVRINRPAFVWGLSRDDFFSHFVTKSLVARALFLTMRAC